MKLPHFVNIISALALILSATGCSDSPYWAEVPGEGDGGGAYMTLRIGATASSRTNPSGGEGGDGPEPGIRNENKVHSLALFFYESGQGLDAPAETPFLHTVFFDNLNLEISDKYDATYKFKVKSYQPSEGHRVAVAINFGPGILGVANLGKLRQYIVSKPWTASEKLSGYDRFTMASAFPDDGVINVKGHTGAEEDPYLVSASVERTAARIDLRFDQEQIADGKELKYVAKGDVGTVYLTHATPVNAMRPGSWLMKHLTVGTKAPDCFSSLKVCAKEELDGSKKPVNYVVEQTTALKGDDTTESTLIDWYGDTRASYMESNYAGIFGEGSNRGLLSAMLSDKLLVDESGKDQFDRSMTIAYVNENTQPIEHHDSRFMTGLLFRAVYIPAKVYKDADLEVDADYERGKNFCLYRPTAADMTESNSICFSSREAAEAYLAKHPEDMAVITEYPGGVCYYHLWLRHANTDSPEASSYHECCPMEYCTVRNNIYRVAVSFTGPGMAKPDIREPETAVSRIFVRKWNFRRQPQIIM